jgi:TPR repeat protein
MALDERLALYANRVGVALSAAGAIGLCLCALDLLLGIWPSQWSNAALAALSFLSFFLGGLIFETTEATVEHVTRRRDETVFADQLKRAQWGDLDSMLYIGAVYMSGESPPLPARVRTDLAEAEFWFKRAIDKRHPRAFYWLARLYWKQRKHEAMKIALEDGVAAGDAPSMSLLGRLHLSGKICEKDLPKADALLRAASAKGSVAAKLGLGRSLLRCRKGSRAWFRGLWICLSSYVTGVTIAARKGLGDERLL